MKNHDNSIKTTFDAILEKDFKEFDLTLKLLTTSGKLRSQCKVRGLKKHTIIVNKSEYDRKLGTLDMHILAFTKWCPLDILKKIDIVLHELGHSYTYYISDYYIGWVTQDTYDVIFKSMIGILKNCIDNTEFLNDTIGNLYRLKMNEVFADIYTLSRLPYAINKLADIDGHVSHIYLNESKLTDSDFIKSDWNINIIRDYINKLYTDTTVEEYNPSRYTKFDVDRYNQDYDKTMELFVRPYLSELVNEDQYTMALMIVLAIANASIYSRHFNDDIFPINMKSYTDCCKMLNKSCVDKDNKLFSNWLDMIFLSYGMSEFPKIWNELIDNKII